MKGLHTLSQIAKQTPEQLDSYTPGMIVRLLGKHVRNLRSQVSRAACLAAGDIFSLHIRGIDQVIKNYFLFFEFLFLTKIYILNFFFF